MQCFIRNKSVIHSCCGATQATEMTKPISVDVTLTDGRVLTLPIDSSSTSSELCSFIAEKIDLKDVFGFSLYISYCDKVQAEHGVRRSHFFFSLFVNVFQIQLWSERVFFSVQNWSLGSSMYHVLDAISLCEQEEKRKGGEEKDAPWTLSFQKELFTPWHDCTTDSISTELIYMQIIHNLKSREYQCDKVRLHLCPSYTLRFTNINKENMTGCLDWILYEFLYSYVVMFYMVMTFLSKNLFSAAEHSPYKFIPVFTSAALIVYDPFPHQPLFILTF